MKTKQKEVAENMASFNEEWDNLGRNIQDIVDRAVNSRDYQKLEQTIRQAVGRAVDVGNEAVRKAMDSVSSPGRAGSQSIKNLYGSTITKTLKGIIQLTFGIPIGLVGAVMLFGGTIGDVPAWQIPIAAIPFALILAGGVWLSVGGIQTMALVRRFKVYRRALGQKTHCTLESLARSVGKSRKFVRRDVYRMIGKGLFREGHLDKEETSLITSNETFRYYEQSRLALEDRQRQEAARAQEAPRSHDPRVQEVLERGNAFLAKIRKCNDDIPGYEISEKISRIEMLVQRIFERVETDPDIVPDLKKLMEYYLPMTVKLLEAYADMDAQPVQGETIQSSKREIEATLDTLNMAFEKLLDDLFKETSLDISSDISALNVLLAQEGLAEDEFSQMKKQQL